MLLSWQFTEKKKKKKYCGFQKKMLRLFHFLQKITAG